MSDFNSITNKLENFLRYVEGLLGLNKYNAGNIFDISDTFVTVPKPIIDEIDKLLSRNELSPQDTVKRINLMIDNMKVKNTKSTEDLLSKNKFTPGNEMSDFKLDHPKSYVKSKIQRNVFTFGNEMSDFKLDVSKENPESKMQGNLFVPGNEMSDFKLDVSKENPESKMQGNQFTPGNTIYEYLRQFATIDGNLLVPSEVLDRIQTVFRNLENAPNLSISTIDTEMTSLLNTSPEKVDPSRTIPPTELTNPIYIPETSTINNTINFNDYLSTNKWKPTDSYGDYLTALMNNMQKTGEYLLSSKGTLFLLSQTAFHLANPRTSQILNPLMYEIGGFGILPDTFDALLIHYEDTVAKELGQAHPGISNVIPGKYGAVEQMLGPYGFPAPRSGIMQIVAALASLVFGAASGGGSVVLDQTGAIDFSKTPLSLALIGINYYASAPVTLPGGGIDTPSMYGEASNLGAGISTTLDEIPNLIIEVHNNNEGKIILLKGYSRNKSGDLLNIKNQSDRYKKIEVLINRYPNQSEPYGGISKEEPLSPSAYNLYTPSEPYIENLFKPLKLLIDMGFGGNENDQTATSENLHFKIKSDYNYSPPIPTKDPKHVNVKKVILANRQRGEIDPLITQLEYEKRGKFVIDENKIPVLSKIEVDPIAASYPVSEITELKEKGLYFPLFFQDLTLGNRYCVFRAYVENYDESFTPNWNVETSYGRSQENVIYNNTERRIELEFKVFAGHPKELVPMYSKLNWLVRNVYPSYNSSGFIDSPPIIRFTLGDMFVGLPAYITNLSITPIVNCMWEMSPGAQVPIAMDVRMSMGILHEHMPSAGSWFYPLSKEGFGETPGDPLSNNVPNSKILYGSNPFKG